MLNQRELVDFSREMNKMTNNFMKEMNDMSRMVGGFGFPFDNKLDFDNVLPFRGMKTEHQEDDKEYKYLIELPGYKKEDISIELENGMLIVNAEKKEEESTKDNVVFSEFYFGKVTRAFPIAKNITEEDIKAKYEDGILTITIPKKVEEIATKSKISIE